MMKFRNIIKNAFINIPQILFLVLLCILFPLQQAKSQMDPGQIAQAAQDTHDGKKNFNNDPANSNVAPTIGKNQCSLETLKKQYMENPDKNCWYCNIVSTMTGAYLEAVANMMNIVENLALLILKYGFLIWLAYYILQQVSSLAPITPGKMLQEILMMGFKVLLATLAVRQGISLLTEFFLDPVMLFGIDYGQTMLNGVMEEEILGGKATPEPGAYGGGSFDGHGATSRW